MPDSEAIKEQFQRDLQSEAVDEGCRLVVYILNTAATQACVIPDITVTKVACAAAMVMNIGHPDPFDPNTPHPVTDAGVLLCRLAYASANEGITFTFEFTKEQTQEIKRVYEWLNTLEGAVSFMNYIRS